MSLCESPPRSKLTLVTGQSSYFSRLVLDGDPIFEHQDEGPDDMSAHVRTALTHTDLMIPIAEGGLDLGTWQGVFLYEHRTAPHRRRLTVTCLTS